MKLGEIKAQLSSMNLSTDGLKPVVADRLINALEAMHTSESTESPASASITLPPAPRLPISRPRVLSPAEKRRIYENDGLRSTLVPVKVSILAHRSQFLRAVQVEVHAHKRIRATVLIRSS